MAPTENERLTRALERALDQQTATAEILRAMSGSPTEVQPVFDAIVRSGSTFTFTLPVRREG